MYCFEVHNGVRPSGVCTVSVCAVSVCLQILNSFSIFEIYKATLFKFGKWVEYGRFHHRGEKFPQKGAWSGSRDPLKFFKPSIFLEWMGLYCLNFASGSTC